MSVSTRESEALRAICIFLSYRGYFFYRTNNAGIYDSKCEVYRSMPQYSMKGVSDVFMLKDGVPYFIEVKSSIGKQSDDQRHFEEMVHSHGGKYILARSIDDLTKAGL